MLEMFLLYLGFSFVVSLALGAVISRMGSDRLSSPAPEPGTQKNEELGASSAVNEGR